jgi:hypothetical protein
MGFHLQGLDPPGDQGNVSAPHPPMPLRNELSRPIGFEGLIPPGSGEPTEAGTPPLMALIPSEVLPLTTVPLSFLKGSSHALGRAAVHQEINAEAKT